MDHLRDSVGLRGYGQKDPLIEYKREAYTLFIEMMDKINRETVELIMKVQIQMQTPDICLNSADKLLISDNCFI